MRIHTLRALPDGVVLIDPVNDSFTRTGPSIQTGNDELERDPAAAEGPGGVFLARSSSPSWRGCVTQIGG